MLTCLAGTHRLLLDANVTTWRIDHARVTLVEALQRAWLTSEVKRNKGSAIAVVLVGSTAASGIGRTKFKEVRAAVDRAVISHTRRMGSRVATSDERYMLTTTQAAVEDTIGRFRNGQKSFIDLAVKPPKGAVVTVGIGFGGTFVTALDSAEQAFQVSAQSGKPAIVREAGTVESLLDDDGGTAISLQETSDAMLELAEQTGLGRSRCAA